MFFVASALVVYFAVLVQICVSVFRDQHMGGLKKAAWYMFLLVLPVLSPIAYVLTSRLRARRQARAATEGAMQSEVFVHIRPTWHSAMVEQMRGAKELLDSGVIDQAEFLELKAQAIRARSRDLRDLIARPAATADAT